MLTQTPTKNPRPKRKRYFGMTAGQAATIAGMGVFICAVFGFAIVLLLDNPSQGSQVSQKVYPTAALPTDAPEPTRTPRLPTKRPPQTSAIASTRSVKSTFEDRGYAFESAKPVMDQERWMGRSSNGEGLILLDLRGSPDLVGTQLFLAIVNDEDLVKQAAYDIAIYLVAVLPDWSDSARWISDNLKDVLLTGEDAYTTFRGVPIRVSRSGGEEIGYFLAITIGEIP